MIGPQLRTLSSETLADQAYAALRAAIISGELPAGEKITERGLAERLRVSTTPVREAIRRLEQDRLVIRLGPRLLEVTEFDDQTAEEVRLAEQALRAVAARLAARNAKPAHLEEMERLLDAGDAELDLLSIGPARGSSIPTELTRLLEITEEFHTVLNSACGNPVILRLLGLVDAFRLAARQGRLLDELATAGPDGAVERYHQHRAIYEAVAAGDGLVAEQLMLAHERRDPSDG